MASEERILTLHPAGKQGVNILKRRYDVVRTWILNTLKAQGTISFDALSDRAVEELPAKLDGKPLWYLVTVKQDLEARQLIEQVPDMRPQHLRLV